MTILACAAEWIAVAVIMVAAIAFCAFVVWVYR